MSACRVFLANLNSLTLALDPNPSPNPNPKVLAAAKAALTVPKDVQRAMLTEFNLKGSFLLWATSADVEAVWRRLGVGVGVGVGVGLGPALPLPLPLPLGRPTSTSRPVPRSIRR